MIISRLKVDLPSKVRPEHVHKAGTEIAPVKRVGPDTWEIEIKAGTDDDPWWETLVIRKDQSEIVEID